MLTIVILQRKKLGVGKVKYAAKVSELVSGGTRIQTHAVWHSKGSCSTGLFSMFAVFLDFLEWEFKSHSHS